MLQSLRSASRPPLPGLRSLYSFPRDRSAVAPSPPKNGREGPLPGRIPPLLRPRSAAATKENDPYFIFYTPIFAYSIFLITFVPVSAEHLRKPRLRPARCESGRRLSKGKTSVAIRRRRVRRKRGPGSEKEEKQGNDTKFFKIFSEKADSEQDDSTD